MRAVRQTGPCVLFRNLDNHDSFVLEPGLHVDEGEAELHELAMQALAADQCFQRNLYGQDYFVQPFNSALRLIIIGAVHVGQFPGKSRVVLRLSRNRG